MWDLVPWPGIKPQATCIGSTESQPLDHQRSPRHTVLICNWQLASTATHLTCPPWVLMVHTREVWWVGGHCMLVHMGAANCLCQRREPSRDRSCISLGNVPPNHNLYLPFWCTREIVDLSRSVEICWFFENCIQKHFIEPKSFAEHTTEA